MNQKGSGKGCRGAGSATTSTLGVGDGFDFHIIAATFNEITGVKKALQKQNGVYEGGSSLLI